MKKVRLYEEFVNEAKAKAITEGISVTDERHFGKKGIIIMIDDNGKKVSAIFKDKKNADKYNRNKAEDIKALLDLAKDTKYPNAIDESVVNEAKATKKDFDKVVKLLKKSKHPFTIMFVPKWDEVEIIVGQDAPDPIIDDINQKLSKAGLYNTGWITIAGDSSSYSRREYEAIERINGGHKDYYY